MDDELHEAAALWGTAENGLYTVQARLSCALKALSLMSKHVPGWEE